MDKCGEKAEGAHKSGKILEEKLVCGEQYHLGGGEGAALLLGMLESALDWSRFPLPFATRGWKEDEWVHVLIIYLLCNKSSQM